MSLNENQLSFLSLGGLTPIARRSAGTREDKPLSYQLSASDDGETYIEPLLGSLRPADLNPADRRVVEEMQRLFLKESPFGVNPDGKAPKLSLYRYPHLLSLLPREATLLTPGREPARFDDSYASVSLRLDPAGEGDEIRPRLILSAGEKETEDFFFLTDSAVCSDGAVRSVSPVGPNYTRMKSIMQPFAKEQTEMYVSLFMSYFDNIMPVVGGVRARLSGTPETAVPTIVLEKVAADRALYMRLISTVDSMSEDAVQELSLTRSATVGEDGGIVVRDIVQPDLEEADATLHKLILSSSPDRQAKKEVFHEDRFYIIPAETAGPFLVNHLARVLRDFRLVGSDKLKEYKVTAAMPKLNLRLSSGIDFLEGSAEVSLGPDRFSIADLLRQYSKNRYVRLSDGNRAIIDSKYISRLERLFKRKGKGDKVRLSFFDLPEVEALINEKLKGTFATKTRKVFEGFNKLQGARLPRLQVKAKLRDYQKEGVKWLRYLFDNNLGGCLADDMGLGKTLQTIALLAMIYPGAGKPSIIIMPRSLLFNWEKEFEKFAPQIRVSTYYGSDRDLRKALDTDVMITTYAVARNDIERLKEVEFEYAILDESQNIKNVSSQTAQAVTLLGAAHRLALSGTPMENNLTELYSLFRFLNPTMFGAFDDFNSAYTYPIQKSGDKEATESLRRKIFPFILRRLKRDVLTELPERIDRTLYVEMSDRQKKLYEERRLAFREEIERSIRESGVAKSQFVMFRALNELRRIASVPESMTEGRVASPKIDELMESLSDAVGNNHKSVVFFNYLSGLEITASRLEKLGIRFETMTGSTTAGARKRIVERFQGDPDCMVLLMTLKVGGVGLNLTAADTVFIFEPWWNKAAEEQAINRLHRIGQKASVVSTSIITEGSIEEKILQLQQQKKELFDALISEDGASSKHLTEDDINFILS